MFKNLETNNQWEELLEKSKTETVVVLKHSNSCPISSGAYSHVENNLDQIGVDINLVVVQTARDVSNLIEEELGMIHQSPQILIIKNGKCVYSESHGSINIEEVKEYL